MTKFSRRDFLTLAGTAPLGFAFSSHLPGPMNSKDDEEEYFDPWVEIDTKNLAWNLSQIQQRVGKRPVMAVIKCNAYGHGLVGVAKSLAKLNVKHMAVVKIQEAMPLRKNGIKGMILNFGPFTQKEAEQIVQHDISQSVFSEEVDKLAQAARKLNKKARVHIKVDTGLRRVGVPYTDAFSFVERVASMPEIAIEGIFTTLSEEEDFDKIQVERLMRICDEAEKKRISIGLRHAASSLAVSKFPQSFLDMVRPGNCIYGIEPLPNLNLRPAMSMKTRVIYIKKLRPGDTIAYHRAYKVKKDMLLATLPLGYSDGYLHRAVNKADVLIKGRRWPLIAYISANHSTVDITGSEGIKIGDEVVLFGKQSDNEITLGEVSQWGESSVYKVAIAMNPLLPRVFI